MATGPGHTDSPLIRELLNRPQDFRFFTAIRVLESLYPDKPAVGEGSSPVEEPVRFRAGTGLGFPGSDIISAGWADDKREQIELVLSFLGLYGIASPLPTYVQQAASADTAGGAALRDFLHMFDQRIYAFYYRAWKKHRVADSYTTRPDNKTFNLLMTLAGLGALRSGETPHRYQKLFAVAGLMSGATRSARGLEVLTAEYFRVGSRVTEFVPAWRDNPAPTTLGDHTKMLGRSMAIGSRIRDRAGSFRLTIGPVGVDNARQFLPGQARHNELKEVVRGYAPDYLAYECRLEVIAEGAGHVRLGESTAPLGWLCWLGKPNRATEAVIIGRFNA